MDRVVTSRIRNLIFKAADSTNTLIFGFSGRNVAEGKELSDWLRKQLNVRSVRINIVEDVVHVFDWLERKATRLGR